jgi:tetratricopeptide (TPR) repeat protein
MIQKYIGVFIVTALLLTGCAGKKEHPADPLVITPEYYYNEGKKYLELNDITSAEWHFKKAVQLRADFAPAYEGLSLAQLERGNLQKAEIFIKEALKNDSDWIPARIINGRLYLAKGEYEYAVNEFEYAVNTADRSKLIKDKVKLKRDAYCRMGSAYKAWGKYIEAQAAFQQVLNIDSTDIKAAAAVKEINEYLAVIEGKPAIINKIAAKKEITYADAAVLFLTELDIEKIFRSVQLIKEYRNKTAATIERNNFTSESIADVAEDYWAKSYIDKAIRLGIMELLPDSTFRPDNKINRAEMAIIIERFLMKAYDDPQLDTRYFKYVSSPYKDILNVSPIFNSVMVVTKRNIMTVFEDDTFRPLNTISGIEAINIITKIKSMF